MLRLALAHQRSAGRLRPRVAHQRGYPRGFPRDLQTGGSLCALCFELRVRLPTRTACVEVQRAAGGSRALPEAPEIFETGGEGGGGHFFGLFWGKFLLPFFGVTGIE